MVPGDRVVTDVTVPLAFQRSSSKNLSPDTKCDAC